MISLPFGPLPAHTPRRFVPERVDWGEWSWLVTTLLALNFLGDGLRDAWDVRGGN